MNPEHQDQAQRLAKYRESVQMMASSADSSINTIASTTEVVEGNGDGEERTVELVRRKACVRDPLIYPGLYAPSGFDIMSILLRVKQRPNAAIDIGFVDSSCALLICDPKLPDTPIVYCSEPFEALTGYTSSEILGRNCRFLQSPDGKVDPGVKRKHTDDNTVFELKNKINARVETQITIVNYKKGGIPFWGFKLIAKLVSPRMHNSHLR